MNDTIYFVKITKSENVAIEDNALKVFIKMKRTQDNGQLVFGECTDDIDVFYMIWNNERCNEVIDSFKTTGVKMEYKNLTDSILKGEYTSAFIETFSEEKNYKHLFLFLQNNLSVDALLDRITEKGENTLTFFEKKYLALNTK